jgi:hypothetical protein
MPQVIAPPENVYKKFQAVVRPPTPEVCFHFVQLEVYFHFVQLFLICLQASAPDKKAEELDQV